MRTSILYLPLEPVPKYTFMYQREILQFPRNLVAVAYVGSTLRCFTCYLPNAVTTHAPSFLSNRGTKLRSLRGPLVCLLVFLFYFIHGPTYKAGNGCSGHSVKGSDKAIE